MRSQRRSSSYVGLPAPSGCVLVVLALLGGSACIPPSPSPEELGPALTAVLEDGALTCDEHLARNQYNQCPASRPDVGTDANGVTWIADRFFFSLIPNPFHPSVDCFRGATEDLGVSSFQCCYDEDALAQDSGSFDFVNPFLSFLSPIAHFFLDVLPPFWCLGRTALAP